MVDCLHIKANTSDMMFYEPLCTVNGQSRAVCEIVIVFAPTSVCTCIQQYPVAFLNTTRNLFRSFFDIFDCDELPFFLWNIQANSFAEVVLNRQFVSEWRFWDNMGRGICMCRVMHMEIIECLQQPVDMRRRLALLCIQML